MTPVLTNLLFFHSPLLDYFDDNDVVLSPAPFDAYRLLFLSPAPFDANLLLFLSKATAAADLLILISKATSVAAIRFSRATSGADVSLFSRPQEDAVLFVVS